MISSRRREQIRSRRLERPLPRIVARQRQPHPAGAYAHRGGNPEQLHPEGRALLLCMLSALKTKTANRLGQHVGETEKIQPKLVRAHRRRRHAIGEYTQLLFLDPVLALAACAILALVDLANAQSHAAFKIRHDKALALILAFGQILGLGDHLARARPRIKRAVTELAKAPERLPGLNAAPFRLCHRP